MLSQDYVRTISPILAVPNMKFSYSDHVLQATGLLNTELPVEEMVPRSKLHASVHVAKRVIQSAIIVAEVSPLNEAARYAVLGTAHGMSDGNSIISGLAFGTATFAIEATAAVATSGLLDSKGSKSIIGKINNKMKRIFKPEPSHEMSPLTQGAIAMLGGSAVLVAAKQVENPGRSRAQNNSLGIKAAALMGSYFAVEGAVTSGAAHAYGWPKTIGAGILILAGAQAGYNRIIKRKKYN